MKLPANVDPQTAALAKKKVEERNRCKTDKLFLATVLGYDFQKDVHEELFQQFIEYDDKKPWAQQSESTKRLILWPRGHFKTYAVHVAVIQAILNFPNIRILLMQFGMKHTQSLMKVIMSHFLGTASGSRFRELFPEFCVQKPGNRKELECTPESFTVPARTKRQLPQATVTCASAKSGKTGQHYDIAFVDDLICDRNYGSPTQLAKAEEEFYMAMPLLDPPFYVVVTGTRYAFGDLYEKIIRDDVNDRKWIISVKTCWTDDGKEVRFSKRLVNQGTQDEKYIGLTREELLDIRDKTPAIFASQYLNKPASTANQLFTEERLNAALVDPDKVPPLSEALIFVDVANGAHADRDDAVILTAKSDHLGKMYVVAGIGGAWNTPQLALQIIATALRHRPLMIYVERSAAGIAFVDYLRLLCQTKGIALPIDFLKSDNQIDAKYIRISALDGYFRAKRLNFFWGLPFWPKLKEQFTRWTGDKNQHDDYPDTVALMAQYFAQNVPVIVPLSAHRHPLLAAMEMQEAANAHLLGTQQQAPEDNCMGDDFAC
jgi:predicted phage terminase large subunit-like protein